VGSQTRVKVGKNKVGSPFRVVRIRNPVWQGCQDRRIARSGSGAGGWRSRGPAFSYNGSASRQGRENAKQFLQRKTPDGCRNSKKPSDRTMVGAGAMMDRKGAGRAAAEE